jgi:hypothetical protein
MADMTCARHDGKFLWVSFSVTEMKKRPRERVVAGLHGGRWKRHAVGRIGSRKQNSVWN